MDEETATLRQRIVERRREDHLGRPGEAVDGPAQRPLTASAATALIDAIAAAE